MLANDVDVLSREPQQLIDGVAAGGAVEELLRPLVESGGEERLPHAVGDREAGVQIGLA